MQRLTEVWSVVTNAIDGWSLTSPGHCLYAKARHFEKLSLYNVSAFS